jgi:hypothetical protein
MPQNHQLFLQYFFELWPLVNPQTQKPYTLQEAIDQAAAKSISSKPTIYGCTNLPFMSLPGQP